MEPKLALFIDHENIEIGTQTSLGRSFDPQRVLSFLNEEGNVWHAVAYADWPRYPKGRYRYAEAGFKLFDRPRWQGSDKNGTDIQLAVDVIDLCHRQPELTTFVLCTGDSDYLPVVKLLKEYGKQVVIIANLKAASQVLVRNCTQFIAYEALVSKPERGQGGEGLDANKKVEQHAVDALTRILMRQKQVAASEGIRISNLKDLIAVDVPSFEEKQLGYRNFSAFLDAHVAQLGFARTFRADGQPVLRPIELVETGANLKAQRSPQRPPRPARPHSAMTSAVPQASAPPQASPALVADEPAARDDRDPPYERYASAATLPEPVAAPRAAAPASVHEFFGGGPRRAVLDSESTAAPVDRERDQSDAGESGRSGEPDVDGAYEGGADSGPTEPTRTRSRGGRGRGGRGRGGRGGTGFNAGSPDATAAAPVVTAAPVASAAPAPAPAAAPVAPPAPRPARSAAPAEAARSPTPTAARASRPPRQTPAATRAAAPAAPPTPAPEAPAAPEATAKPKRAPRPRKPKADAS
jgi:uncharacterized LabA/DUF88 family protein